MPEWLPNGDVSAIGVLVVVFLAIVWGKLIPVKTHDRELAREAEKALVWRDVANERKQTLERQQGALDQLVEASKTSMQLLQALNEAVTQRTGP
jgi:hypothetical protein